MAGCKSKMLIRLPIRRVEYKKNRVECQGGERHFRALERLKTPIGSGGMICLAEHNLPITSSTQSIPIGAL